MKAIIPENDCPFEVKLDAYKAAPNPDACYIPRLVAGPSNLIDLVPWTASASYNGILQVAINDAASSQPWDPVEGLPVRTA